MSNFQKLLIIWLATSVSGCLMTRTEVEEVEQRKVVQSQVSTLQKTHADAQSRFNEVNEDLRALNGRIEALENRVTIANKDKEKSQNALEQQLAETNKKLHLLQEETQKLETQVAFLNQELIKVSSNTHQAAEPIAAGKKEDFFQNGEEAMNKKDWRKAILAFQKYRESFPKGKKVPAATFRIGQAFYELGMKDDAETFFRDLVKNYPESSFAKKAQDRLKKMR